MPYETPTRDSWTDEHDLARMDRDNREAQEEDEPDEYEVMQHDDRRYENHS